MTNAQRNALDAIVFKTCMTKYASMNKEAGIKDAITMWQRLGQAKKTFSPELYKAMKINPVKSVLGELVPNSVKAGVGELADIVKKNPKATAGIAGGVIGGTALNGLAGYGLYKSLFGEDSKPSAGVNAAAGGLAGLAAAGGLYGGLGLVPAMRRKRLLRALIAAVGGAGAGALGYAAANNYQRNA